MITIGNDSVASEDISLECTLLTNTQFTIQVKIGTTTKIWGLKIKYMTIKISYPFHLNLFYDVPANYSNGNLVAFATSDNNKITYNNQINYTAHAISQNFSFTNFSTPYTKFIFQFYLTSYHL